MKIKLSATFEGKCKICGENKTVFSAGDEDTKKIVTVCGECAKSFGNTQTSDIIEKYGEVDANAFESVGVSIKGLDKLQKELKERQEKSKKL